jgi:hypothetical protein
MQCYLVVVVVGSPCADIGRQMVWEDGQHPIGTAGLGADMIGISTAVLGLL